MITKEYSVNKSILVPHLLDVSLLSERGLAFLPLVSSPSEPLDTPLLD